MGETIREPGGAKKPHREFTANLFIERLQAVAARKLFLQIILGILLFILGFFALTFGSNEMNARKNLAMLKEVYLSLYEKSTGFLDDEATVRLALKKLEDSSAPEFEYALNRYNADSAIRNKAILMRADGGIVYATFPEDELSNYLSNYNRAICNVVRNLGSPEIYTTVYFDTGSYSDYMFVKPLMEEDRIVGYLSLFIMGSDWSFYLSDKNYDGVIIDERQNVIYRSKMGLADSSGKFYPQDRRICVYNDERYWMLGEELEPYGVSIYSLVYYPRSNVLFVGVMVIVILGFLWYHLSKWMSRSMAEYNATYLSLLVKEIRKIQDGDHTHRIYMNTNNEFDEVAHRINRMLDSIRELNDRNTELILLNSALEMSQLEAQMNPHFLYNTLEIIRSLLLLDAERAEELIEKLTGILRYSVNKAYRDVHLGEDMEYVNDYLAIQKVRFGSRFQCSIDFDEACLECMVPKLLLQPIIENSIKYGFKAKMELHVSVEGHVEDGILVIRVRDDGPGMAAEEARKLTASLKEIYNQAQSLGLHNIARRLYLQYGEKSGIVIESREKEGFEVVLSIDQNYQKV